MPTINGGQFANAAMQKTHGGNHYNNILMCILYALVCPASGSSLFSSPNVRRSLPVCVSQSLIMQSSLPDAIMLPLVPNAAMHCTAPVF